MDAFNPPETSMPTWRITGEYSICSILMFLLSIKVIGIRRPNPAVFKKTIKGLFKLKYCNTQISNMVISNNSFYGMLGFEKNKNSRLYWELKHETFDLVTNDIITRPRQFYLNMVGPSMSICLRPTMSYLKFTRALYQLR